MCPRRGRGSFGGGGVGSDRSSSRTPDASVDLVSGEAEVGCRGDLAGDAKFEGRGGVADPASPGGVGGACSEGQECAAWSVGDGERDGWKLGGGCDAGVSHSGDATSNCEPKYDPHVALPDVAIGVAECSAIGESGCMDARTGHSGSLVSGKSGESIGASVECGSCRPGRGAFAGGAEQTKFAGDPSVGQHVGGCEIDGDCSRYGARAEWVDCVEGMWEECDIGSGAGSSKGRPGGGAASFETEDGPGSCVMAQGGTDPSGDAARGRGDDITDGCGGGSRRRWRGVGDCGEEGGGFLDVGDGVRAGVGGCGRNRGGARCFGSRARQRVDLALSTCEIGGSGEDELGGSGSASVRRRRLMRDVIWAEARKKPFQVYGGRDVGVQLASEEPLQYGSYEGVGAVMEVPKARAAVRSVGGSRELARAVVETVDLEKVWRLAEQRGFGSARNRLVLRAFVDPELFSAVVLREDFRSDVSVSVGVSAEKWSQQLCETVAAPTGEVRHGTDLFRAEGRRDGQSDLQRCRPEQASSATGPG